MNEQVLLDKALLALKNNTDIAFEDEVREAALLSDGYSDAVVRLRKNSAVQDFCVSIKRQPSIAQLGVLINNYKEGHAKSYSAKMLVVADYVNQSLSQFLKENECNFIDSVGNAYLNFGTVFVYITGNKGPKILAGTKSSRAFQSTGLKLIFNLLCHPEDLINRNYRDLSELTGVSLGSIGWIINDLKGAGYLAVDENNKRQWLNKDELIKRWAIAYPEKLRPKLVLGYYRSLQENWQEGVDIKSFGALWGGEVAADELTHYLKAEFSTIYTQEQLGKLVLMNGLKGALEKSSANVEVLQKFWQFESLENPHLAPALLVYADLIASGDSRNLETAKIIYERCLNATD